MAQQQPPATARTVNGLPPQWRRWFDYRLASLRAHSLLRRLRPIHLIPAPIPLNPPRTSAEDFAQREEWVFGARNEGNGGKPRGGEVLGQMSSSSAGETEEAEEGSARAAWWDVAAVEVLISEEAFQRWLEEPAGEEGQLLPSPLFPIPSIQSQSLTLTPSPPPPTAAPAESPETSNLVSPAFSSLSPPPSSSSSHPSPSPSHSLHPPSASNPPASRRLVLFSANDSLGLASHPRVRAAAAKAAWEQGMGPRASALVTGHTAGHQGLEGDIARLKGTQACLLCPTGFAANLAVLASLAPVARSRSSNSPVAGRNQSSSSSSGGDGGDSTDSTGGIRSMGSTSNTVGSGSSGSSGSRSMSHVWGQKAVVESSAEENVERAGGSEDSLAVFSDELNHASIIDALRLLVREGSGAVEGRAAAGAAAAVVLHVYRHNDMTHLDELLAASSAARKLVVTDSLFSMDGDFAPLPALAALKVKHGFLLVLDEAHATLVCGSTGGGAAEEMGVKGAVDVHVGTLSKAVGCLGGFIACSSDLRDFFASRGRSFIFSTALPVPVVAAARASLAVAAEEQWRQREVWRRVQQLGEGLGTAFTSPICPIVLGSADLALQASRHLLLSGFHVPAIRPPTVAPGSSRLRVALSASHTRAHVSALITVLRPILALSRSISRTIPPPPAPSSSPSQSPSLGLQGQQQQQQGCTANEGDGTSKGNVNRARM